MEKSSNCTNNDEKEIQKINSTLEDSSKQDEFPQETVSSTDISTPDCPIPNTPDEPPSKSKNSNKYWLTKWSQMRGINKFLFWLLGFCLPIESDYSGSTEAFVVCIPSTPAVLKKEPEKEKKKPVGVITRNKDVDFIAGKLINKCTCGRKNGLAIDCPRISCQNNPGCTMSPPQCWPQFKEPEPPPPPPPDQKLICVPIDLVYYDPS